jgi:hypothetical protein
MTNCSTIFPTVGLVHPHLVKRKQITHQFCGRSKRNIKLSSVLQITWTTKTNHHYHCDSSRSSFASLVKLMFCGLSGAIYALHPPTAVCLPPTLELLYQETPMHHSPRNAAITYALRLDLSVLFNSLKINWHFALSVTPNLWISQGWGAKGWEEIISITTP